MTTNRTFEGATSTRQADIEQVVLEWLGRATVGQENTAYGDLAGQLGVTEEEIVRCLNNLSITPQSPPLVRSTG